MQYTQDFFHKFPPVSWGAGLHGIPGKSIHNITFWSGQDINKKSHRNWFHCKPRFATPLWWPSFCVRGPNLAGFGRISSEHTSCCNKKLVFFQGTGSFQFTMPTPLAEVSMASEVSSGLWGGGDLLKKTVEWVGCQKMLKNGEWFVVKKSFGHLTRNGHPWIMKNLREVGISMALPKIDLKKTFAVLEREKLSPAAFARRALCLSTWVQSKPCRMRVPRCVEWSYFGAFVASLLLSCQLHLNWTDFVENQFGPFSDQRIWKRMTSHHMGVS